MRNSGEVVNFCLRLFFQHPWLDYIYKIIVGDLHHHVSSFKKATLVPTPVPAAIIVVNLFIIPNISMGIAFSMLPT